MKTIGLLGGMSWESTISYYQYLNRYAQAQYGGLHSAPILLYSINFAELETLQHQHQWPEITEELIKGAKRLEAGGADCIVICTNTMHKVADPIAESISLPLVHIADAVAQRLIDDGISTAALLGTRFTMQEDFYRRRLNEEYNIEVLTPTDDEQTIIHNIIYQELCQGEISAASRQQYLTIIDKLHQRGAQGIILGCTEIPLLVQQTHTNIPLYDTAQLHAHAAAARYL